MSKPEFVYVTYIETTAEKLWTALTDGDFTARYWFGVRLRSDAGKVVEYDPPRRLAYTFVNLSEEYRDDLPALATFELEPHGNLVKLTLTHAGFAEGGKMLPAISQGWPAILSSLKSMLETGQPLDIPRAAIKPEG
jgi:uncharacterized protein YndB with AHSA1/START domain